MVGPETVIRWHRAGFRSYWRWKSCWRRGGRPRLTLEERELIRRLARENRLWGAPRIHGELAKLGLEVSQATVSKYMKQARSRPPSQSWATFLKNHAREMVSIDFFEVPTALMKPLSVLLVLGHARRKVLGFAVLEAPSGAAAADAVVQALDFPGAPGAGAGRVCGLLQRQPDALGAGEKDCLDHRHVEKVHPCEITGLPVLGGLHHRFAK